MAETEELVAESRTAEPSGEDKLKAYLEQRLQEAASRHATAPVTRATEAAPGRRWEVVAYGPWQEPFDPPANPGFIIRTGETGFIAVVVSLDAVTAEDLAGHRSRVHLSWYTSNNQTMQPAAGDVSGTRCVEIESDKTWYVVVIPFTPREAGCLHQMNVCAGVCNCEGTRHPEYAGFVRHVWDYDADDLDLIPGVPAATPGWKFDRPIRFMVMDPDAPCDCG